ncbi:PPE family protein [Mycobacterium seoulense]|uniref:PPE family protein n=1 Tax=Mycobacterium seoulense TaxID=386911 RepID=A0A7I7P6N9_9MYCO|nr:PPE family protein [Mycobacterium seoulense]MCV7439495.1 PPE family protein [Mycobacterium seoulense]BBY04563.1 PPE family protein [Mycobacterium seoulense]
MDLFAPPEVTSTLIHSGPGAGSLIEAAGAWQQLAVELENSVAGYASSLSTLIESWDGPSSMAMLQAVQPYLIWLRTTAQQAQQMATSAEAAATAFAAVRSAVVTPAQVTANRTRLAQLLATNRFGQNTAAIAATQAEYQTMWANNSAAMTQYQAATNQTTSQLSQFNSPMAVTDPAASINQNAAVSNASLLSTASSTGNAIDQLGVTPFDPNAGWFSYFSTWGNQFISSGFPINMLSYLAQNTSAQALQGVGSDIGLGLSEGEGALASSVTRLASALQAAPGGAATGAMGVGVSLGKLTAPPAVVGLLPATQTPVQLASSVSPLPADAGLTGMPLMPMMAPATNSAGSGWRKRKQQKFEDLEYGAELPKKVIHRPPSGG